MVTKAVSPSLFVAVLVLSSGLVALLTPVAIRLGRRHDLVDLPGGRRKHAGPVVRIGGLALFPAFVVATLVSLIMDVPRTDPLEVTRLTGVLLGMGLVWVTGLLDDQFRLSFWGQLAGLVVATLVAALFKVFVEVFNNPFADSQIVVDWYLMLPLTLVWVVGMTGTINMLDGLDGLATGVTGISAIVLFAHMLRLGQYSVALLPLALFGCCMGFLPYNYSPARVFLGGGAFVLGYGLAVLSIVAGAKVASALLVLWLPIVDVVWQVYSRWRRGQPVGLGDRGHLHYRLQDMGWPQGRIVLMYYAITACLGAIALLISSRLLKFAILVAAGLIIVAILALLTRSRNNRIETGR